MGITNNRFCLEWKENLEIAVASNNGISISKGKYILMVDSDDMLVKYSLKPHLTIVHWDIKRQEKEQAIDAS